MRWAAAMHEEGLSTMAPKEYARFIFGETAVADWPSNLPKAQ